MPMNNAGFAVCHGLMPADFITISSRSVSMRLYTKRTATNSDIGERIANNRGIRQDVILMNKLKGRPLLVIISMKRKD